MSPYQNARQNNSVKMNTPIGNVIKLKIYLAPTLRNENYIHKEEKSRLESEFLLLFSLECFIFPFCI